MNTMVCEPVDIQIPEFHVVGAICANPRIGIGAIYCRVTPYAAQSITGVVAYANTLVRNFQTRNLHIGAVGHVQHCRYAFIPPEFGRSVANTVVPFTQNAGWLLWAGATGYGGEMTAVSPALTATPTVFCPGSAPADLVFTCAYDQRVATGDAGLVGRWQGVMR
ncbi:hypothetical protein KYG_21179 [Acidovorax sp. NO-1]|nr:hypothetical protein KYG_21179 [Acidovorax sp. NO-1]